MDSSTLTSEKVKLRSLGQFQVFYFFLWRNSTHKKNIKNPHATFRSDISIRLKNIKKTNKHLPLRYFYMPKRHKKHTSIFHSDIFMHLKSIKSTQASNFSLRYFYVSKKHKKQTSNFLFIKCIKCKQAIFAQIFLCVKKIDVFFLLDAFRKHKKETSE